MLFGDLIPSILRLWSQGIFKMWLLSNLTPFVMWTVTKVPNSVLQILERKWQPSRLAKIHAYYRSILFTMERGNSLAMIKAKDLLQIKFEAPEMEAIIIANWWFLHTFSQNLLLPFNKTPVSYFSRLTFSLWLYKRSSPSHSWTVSCLSCLFLKKKTV